MKRHNKNPTHKLIVRRIVPNEKPVQTPDGKIVKIAKIEEVEVASVNLGSIKNPNKEIISVKLIPIEYEKEKGVYRKDFRRFKDLIDKVFWEDEDE